MILAEKTEYLGGTAAYAGAGLWLPLNSVSAAAFADTREKVDAYIAATTDGTGFADLREAYLDAAPEMVDFLLQDRPSSSTGVHSPTTTRTPQGICRADGQYSRNRCRTGLSATTWFA